jgi:hypothetical protein
VRMGGRAPRAGPLSRGLAAWLAVLLAIAPLARPLPAGLGPIRSASAPEFAVADASGTQAKLPAPRLQPSQPWDLGVLARWPWVETKLGLSPARAPFVRPGALDHPPVAPNVTAAQVAEPGDVFHRSSVGTARNPTGPPA